MKSMKFFNFSELGSCCRPQGTQTPTPTPAAAGKENGGQASSGHASTPRRNGRCSASMKNVSAGHWRPALQAITEDGLVDPVVESKSKQMVQKKSPTKGGSNMAKSHRYNSTKSSKDSRANPVPVIIPTFSPTPFVF